MLGRIKSIQAGRAVAALLVVAYHASATIFQNPRFWSEAAFDRFFDFGHAGVYFFFVLSGFIIAAAHHGDIGRSDRAPNYAVRRFIRVYPAYWIVLLPIVALYLATPELSKPELTDHKVIANSVLLVGATSRASLAVAWTLFHEILFYALFAVAIVSRRVGTVLLALWFAACFVAQPLFGPAVEAIYALAPINLLFAAGLAVFFVIPRRPLPAPALCTLLGCLGFLAAGLFEVRVGFASTALSLASYGSSSTLILAGLVSMELRRPVAVPALLLLLGDASYAIYLTHYPALSIVSRVWQKLVGARSVPVDISFLAIVGSCVAAGVAFHLMVEKPVIAMLTGAWRRRQGKSSGEMATSA